MIKNDYIIFQTGNEEPIFFSSLSQLRKFKNRSTDGSVVEFSPATREARVRFPVSA